MPKATSITNDDWETEDDLRILCKAKEIQKDPKRMAKCQKLAEKKMVDMARVAGKEADQ